MGLVVFLSVFPLPVLFCWFSTIPCPVIWHRRLKCTKGLEIRRIQGLIFPKNVWLLKKSINPYFGNTTEEFYSKIQTGGLKKNPTFLGGKIEHYSLLIFRPLIVHTTLVSKVSGGVFLHHHNFIAMLRPSGPLLKGSGTLHFLKMYILHQNLKEVRANLGKEQLFYYHWSPRPPSFEILPRALRAQ